jgi:hypothetical protein
MDKRNKIKAGLSFGILMALSFILINLFTADHLSAKEVTSSILSALMAGAISGLLFGWLMGLMANALTKRIKLLHDENETILFETQASHFKGIEAVGGLLYLTAERLVFKSHKYNIQNHTLSVNLDEIASVSRYKVFGISNNGILLETKNGSKEKFSVVQPDDWLTHLEIRNKTLL